MIQLRRRQMCRPTLAFVTFALGVRDVSAAPVGDCMNPLFMTHWAGKNDIQTLMSTPGVKTNLKLCPAYNRKASCCRQMLESEQSEFYEFWVDRFHQKIVRANAHRLALSMATIGAARRASTLESDLEQNEVALARYDAVLRTSDSQTRCFSQILTFVAGMMCFCCKPDWGNYLVFSSGHSSESGVSGDEAKRVVMVRMDRSVCDDIWASCEPYGLLVTSLISSLRDSPAAREAVGISQESLADFAGREALCSFLHDEVALHPFKLPAREDLDAPMVSKRPAAVPTASSSQRRVGESDSASFVGLSGVDNAIGRNPFEAGWNVTRRDGIGDRQLAFIIRQDLDVLAEGRDSTFDQTWRGGILSSSNRASGLYHAMSASLSVITAVVSLATLIAANVGCADVVGAPEARARFS
eukprot:TRINITY_DN73910_c0_g1_i1.p1 TRINITY_DN73910_c0_g1~~TRINITY_DN73910_c0_g1_i1.p1  ORF type:complete len:412 (+),score=54.18 TRINITY_DN73910_c0_g1_i1:226-1461(+)